VILELPFVILIVILLIILSVTDDYDYDQEYDQDSCGMPVCRILCMARHLRVEFLGRSARDDVVPSLQRARGESSRIGHLGRDRAHDGRVPGLVLPCNSGEPLRVDPTAVRN